MGEMNPMSGHVEKSVENMGKQLYAEGTSPITTGTTIGTVTPASVIEGPDNAIKTADGGNPVLLREYEQGKSVVWNPCNNFRESGH